jgi:23S rRNA (guanosine2251-2'-O)-methyltransferase
VLGEIRRRAKEASVPLSVVPKREIERLAGDINHQGVVARAGRYRYATIDDLLHETTAPSLLFVDGVTDPHNLGSLLRSADGAGFTGLVIPAHRAVGVTPAVRRVSAGAAEVVRVARVPNMSQALDEARRAGLWILGLDEKSERALWSSDLAQPPVGLVLGSEDRGISRLVREHCDDLVGIPFFGKIGSLNVAVAGAVAMFEVARRRDSARL